MRRLLSPALLLCLLFPAPVRAEEHAAQHYARGLVEFHAENYPAALELFERAVAADATDPYARYYRAVARGRGGDWAGAEADLREVVRLAPDLAQPRLELGTTLLEQSRYGEALQWFERAGEDDRLAGRAALYTGICKLRMGDNDGALAALSAPASGDQDVAVAVHYYRGIANERLGADQAATENFRWVADHAADTDMGHEAATFIDALESGRAGSPYSLYAKIGFAYDSNVLLAPDGGTIDISRSDKEDGRSEITVGGTVRSNLGHDVSIVAGYEVYQNLHFDLSEFDLQDHRLSAQLIWKADERVTTGLLARYDYYFLDDDSFLSENVLLPWLSVSQGSFGRTDIHYRFRLRDYRQAEFENALNGDNHAVGFRQYKYFGTADRYVAAGYQYVVQDLDDTDDDRFAFDAHELGAGIGWDLPFEIDSELDYRYRHRDYDSASDGRDDDQHRVIFELRRPIRRNLSLIATYIGTFNESDDPLFEYDRHIGSLTLEVTL